MGSRFGPGGSGAPGRGRAAPALAGAALLAFAWVVYANAWSCDDAFINFRCVDNLLHGHGMRWNPGERVQVFTDPLWVLGLAAFTALFGNPYIAALGAGMVLSFAAFALLLRRFLLPAGWPAVAALSTALLFSKAFVDFTTSGIETPLSYLLLLLFLSVFLRGGIEGGKESRAGERPPRKGDLFRLSFLSSLLFLAHPDLLLLVLPALGAVFLRTPPGERPAGQALAGFLPLLLWEGFSLFYYGSFVPNSAWAKLNSHLPLAVKAGQGALYFADSLLNDPLTLPLVGGALAASLLVGRGLRPLSLGMGAFLLYTLVIGGDFMSGRFFAVPFLMAAVILSRAFPWTPRRGVALLVAAAAVGGFGPHPPPFSGASYRAGESFEQVTGPWGVADERGFYYRAFGLRRVLAREDHGFLDPEMEGDGYIPARVIREGQRLREGGKRVVAWEGPLGAMGYFAGPAVHLVDVWAVCDPFLARIPYEGEGFRPGHLERALPAGYLESLARGGNRLADLRMARLYRRVRLLASAPLLDRERWKAILGPR